MKAAVYEAEWQAWSLLFGGVALATGVVDASTRIGSGSLGLQELYFALLATLASIPFLLKEWNIARAQVWVRDPSIGLVTFYHFLAFGVAFCVSLPFGWAFPHSALVVPLRCFCFGLLAHSVLTMLSCGLMESDGVKSTLKELCGVIVRITICVVLFGLLCLVFAWAY